MSLSPGVQVQRSKVKGWGSPELAPCSVAVSSRCRLSNRDLEVLVRGPELVPSLVPSGNFRRQTYSWLWKALLPCTPAFPWVTNVQLQDAESRWLVNWKAQLPGWATPNTHTCFHFSLGLAEQSPPSLRS